MTESEYKDQIRKYASLTTGSEKITIKPILNEDSNGAGSEIDGHYYYMNAWAFDKILKSGPAEHIDFGGMLSWLEIVARFTKVRYFDIQTIPRITETKIQFNLGSVTDSGLESDSVESLSCLHVAEHIGLGRYGDSLDPQGTEKACKELARVLKPGGRLYFAVPVGKQETAFNAHRILNPESILEWFKGLKLIEMSGSHIYPETPNPGETNFIRNVDIEQLKNSLYSCGLFEFTKES